LGVLVILVGKDRVWGEMVSMDSLLYFYGSLFNFDKWSSMWSSILS